jgi:hypothetical protein
VRTIVYADDELERALDEMPKGIKVVAMLNNEHEAVRGDWSGWRQAVTAFAKRFEGRVHAVECGNELDGWGLPPEKGAFLVREAYLPLNSRGMLTIMGGVASGHWPEWLQRACDLSRGSYDAVALHPYGKRPDGWKDGTWGFGLLREAINTASIAGGDVPVYLTEWGVKVGDAGGPAGQAEYLEKGVLTIRSIGPKVVPFAAYFAWADKIGTEQERDSYNAFGLRDMQMKKRLAWDMFRDRMRDTPPADPPKPKPDPKPEPKPVEPPKPMKIRTIEDAYRVRWQAIAPIEYRPDFGIPSAWRRNPQWGSPLTDEVTLDDGRVVQVFANTMVQWVDGAAREITE